MTRAATPIDTTSTGSPKAPVRQRWASGRYQLSTRRRAAETAPATGRASAVPGRSTVTTAPPPSRATRDSRTSSASSPPGTPVTTTSAKPPLRSSSSAADSERSATSRVFNEVFKRRPGRTTITPRGQKSPSVEPAPSTHAARSPRPTASTHVPRSNAVAPAPPRQTVRQPRGSPRLGSAASSAPTPVATAGARPRAIGIASGKRSSRVSFSLWRAVIGCWALGYGLWVMGKRG